MTTQTKTTWRKVKLGDIANVQWGDTNTTKAAYKSTGFTAFSATGPDGLMDHFDFDRDGVVLSAIGANCGETWFTCGKWSAIKNTIVFWEKSSKSDAKFLFYKTHNKKLWPIRGSAQPFISQGDAREMELLIPENPADQKRIADILSTFDDKIEFNNKICRTLEQVAQVIFKEWFVSFRFSGHKKVKMIDSELGKIPEGWEVKKLGDIVDLDKGISYKGSGLDKSGMPMINLGCFMRGGKFTYENLKYYSGDYKPRHIAQVGDLLVSNTDITQGREIIGNPVIVEEWLGNKKYLFTHHIYILRPKAEVDKIFVYFLLRQSAFRARVIGAASGTNILGLSREAISSFEIISPPAELMEKFTILASQVLEKISKIKHENQKLVALRDLLLPKLMSGEIRV